MTTAFRPAAVLALALSGTLAHATTNEFAPQLSALAEAEFAPLAAAPVVIEAVRAQNARHEGLDPARVEELDQTWRAEVGAATSPMIDSVIGTAASAWLRERAAASGGLVTEVFITDALGLNVAQSDVTSDYWQGDEAKFTEVFGKPAGTLRIGGVELDESTQTYQSQVSMPVTDPESGASIGTVTIGVNLEMLQ